MVKKEHCFKKIHKFAKGTNDNDNKKDLGLLQVHHHFIYIRENYLLLIICGLLLNNPKEISIKKAKQNCNLVNENVSVGDMFY